MSLQSWVTSANQTGTDFPLENLPYGVFENKGNANLGVAIGGFILDLRRCADAGFLDPDGAGACRCDSLNALMELGPLRWSALRRRITELLTAGSPAQSAL